MHKTPPAAPLPPFEAPPRLEFVAGEIVVLGPGSTGFSMTPDAARQFQARLDAILRTVPA